MTAIESIILDVPDTRGANDFYAALGVDRHVRVRAPQAPSTGFRGYTLSLVVPQPSTVDNLVGAAVEGGATLLKPAAKGLWGYGGAVRAPDGAIWTVATSAKKDTGPATRQIDDIVLLLGVADVKASKQFYLDRGLTVSRSFGSRYAEFAAEPGRISLALNRRRALARNAGVEPDGTGSHLIAVRSDAGAFTDPDGFVWETGQDTP